MNSLMTIRMRGGRCHRSKVIAAITYRRRKPLKPGDKAPDFTLLDQHGEKFHLSESIKRRKAPHLVYFYPKADTPGCTKQACGLRDIADQVGDTTIVGISPDPPSRQARFDEKYGLGFPLLSDEDHAVADAFGVWGERSMYGRSYMGIIRSAFLIDAKGRVANAWYKISPADTPKRLLEALAS
jgi:peroxiredoxin Q/BCP